VRPIVDYVHYRFLTNYQPSRDISVDEGMIKFKGKIFCKQYMPKKPTKNGIKVWMAADSSNGYEFIFSLYEFIFTT